MRSVYCPYLRKYLEVPERPSRVATLSPSITATVIDLGLKDLLVGYSPWCRLLKYLGYEVPELPVLGTYDRLITEEVLKASPDLILISGGAQEVLINSLEELRIPYYVVKLPHGMDFLDIPTEVGYVLNATEAAHELLRVCGVELVSTIEYVRELGLVGTKLLTVLDIHELVLPGFANHITQLLNFVGFEVVNSVVRGSYLWGPEAVSTIKGLVREADAVLIQAPKTELSMSDCVKYLDLVGDEVPTAVLPILTLTDYSVRSVRRFRYLVRVIKELISSGGVKVVSYREFRFNPYLQ